MAKKKNTKEKKPEEQIEETKLEVANCDFKTIDNINIESLIRVIRGQQVMLDSDLAMLYRVETKRLNEQVKRNIERFPADFMFQLTKEETACLRSQIATLNNGLEPLRSQIVTSKGKGGTRYLPYAFTRNGVAMLSSVLPTGCVWDAWAHLTKMTAHQTFQNVYFRERLTICH